MLVLLALAACTSPADPAVADPADTSDTSDPAVPTVPVPDLADVLGDCDGRFVTPTEYPNQLARGDDLHRLELTDPGAVCNDGTPAVLYVRGASDPTHAGDWVLHLQGGSHCTTFEDCEVRWCGAGFYDASKMSSTWTPDAIAGAGIFSQDPANGFAGWNHAFFYYCSSDVWQGKGGATLTAGDGSPVRIERAGHDILEAGLAVLEEGAASDDGAATLPSILDASLVLFTGTSGGSVGAQMHLDWLRERWPAEIGLLGVFDAALNPDPAFVPPAVAALLDANAAAEQGVIAADADEPMFGDASCLSAVGPEDVWQCTNSSRLPYLWITTPFLARMDLKDPPTGDVYQAAGATPAEFSDAVAASLDAIAAREIGGRTGGAYGPACGEHLGLEVDPWFLAHPIVTPTVTHTLETAIAAYIQGDSVSAVDAEQDASRCR